MICLKGVSEITISYSDPMDLENMKTNNPMAESEFPDMLRMAIKDGISVYCVNLIVGSKLKLEVTEDGKFCWKPVLQKVE